MHGNLYWRIVPSINCCTTAVKELGRRSAKKKIKKPYCYFSHLLEIEQQSRLCSSPTGLACCFKVGLTLGGSWRIWGWNKKASLNVESLSFLLIAELYLVDFPVGYILRVLKRKFLSAAYFKKIIEYIVTYRRVMRITYLMLSIVYIRVNTQESNTLSFHGRISWC